MGQVVAARGLGGQNGRVAEEAGVGAEPAGRHDGGDRQRGISADGFSQRNHDRQSDGGGAPERPGGEGYPGEADKRRRWSSQGPSAPITNSARCSRTT